MKVNVVLCAALLALGLTGCEQPAEQDEPEQPEPDTKATMQSPPETESQPAQIETPPERGANVETTTSETGERGEEEESETDEPPPK